MTPAQVLGLVADLLTWRHTQGSDSTPGGQIETVHRGADSVTVTFADGTRAVITVTVTPPAQGGPE